MEEYQKPRNLLVRLIENFETERARKNLVEMKARGWLGWGVLRWLDIFCTAFNLLCP